MSGLTEDQILAGKAGEWGGILLARLDLREARARRKAGLPSAWDGLTQEERLEIQTGNAEIYGDMGYIPTPLEGEALESVISAGDSALPPVY